MPKLLLLQSANTSIATTISTIDLSNPWSNVDTSIWGSISKNTTASLPGPPTLNDGAIFSEGSHLWLYGGAISLALQPVPPIPPNGIWKYDLVREQWSQGSTGGIPVQRLHLGITAQSTDSKAYYLGGAKGPKSDAAFNAEPDAEAYLVGSLLTFDEQSESFRNSSTKGLNEYGTVADGFLNLIESLGKGGVLISFGGFTNTIASAMSLRDGDLKDPELRWSMQNISVYDIANQKWYQQQATGDVPTWRYLGCSVIVGAPDNSSYSIYVYGGWGATNTQKNDGNVYVLSIPSFKWIRVTTDTDQRSRHQCHLTGKSQMIVVGGTRPVNDNIQPDGPSGCDTDPKFSQGLGIFSLNDHTWRTDYNPSDALSAYKIHPTISNVIGGNANGGSTKQTPANGFSSKSLQRLLGVEDDANPVQKPTPTPTSTSSNTTSPVDTNNAGPNVTPKKGNGLSSSAIAGAVAGSITASAFLCILAFFLYRSRSRRRQQQRHLAQRQSDSQRPPLRRNFSELADTSSPVELRGSEKEESLAQQYRIHEMNGSAGGKLEKPLPERPEHEYSELEAVKRQTRLGAGHLDANGPGKER